MSDSEHGKKFAAMLQLIPEVATLGERRGLSEPIHTSPVSCGWQLSDIKGVPDAAEETDYFGVELIADGPLFRVTYTGMPEANFIVAFTDRTPDGHESVGPDGMLEKIARRLDDCLLHRKVYRLLVATITASAEKPTHFTTARPGASGRGLRYVAGEVFYGHQLNNVPWRTTGTLRNATWQPNGTANTSNSEVKLAVAVDPHRLVATTSYGDVPAFVFTDYTALTAQFIKGTFPEGELWMPVADLATTTQEVVRIILQGYIGRAL